MVSIQKLQMRHWQFPMWVLRRQEKGFSVMARKSRGCAEAYKNFTLLEVNPNIDTARAKKRNLSGQK